MHASLPVTRGHLHLPQVRGLKAKSSPSSSAQRRSPRIGGPNPHWNGARFASEQGAFGSCWLAMLVSAPIFARQLVRALVWVGASLVLVLLLFGLVSFVLMFVLYPDAGVGRLHSDWQRLEAADALAKGAPVANVVQHFYGDQFDAGSSADVVHDWFAAELDQTDPVVFDVALARFIALRYGQVDARSIPAGVYVAASPIGPDVRVYTVINQFFVFPRHGYLLIVPPLTSGEPPRPAVQAVASLQSDFLPDAQSHGALYSERMQFNVDAMGFPTPAEPIHDLFLITDDPALTRRLLAGIGPAIERIQDAELPYRVLQRNSNAAIGCLLLASGLPDATLDAFTSAWLIRARLPGIDQPLWERGRNAGAGECRPPATRLRS